MARKRGCRWRKGGKELKEGTAIKEWNTGREGRENGREGVIVKKKHGIDLMGGNENIKTGGGATNKQNKERSGTQEKSSM